MNSKKTGNLTLKIIAVAIALFLWLYIQMVENPETEYTFRNVNVDLTNQTALLNKNLSILGKDEFKTDITLRCQRWSLTELKNEGFLVYCDLSEIHDAGEAVLPVRVVVNNDKISVVNRSPASVTLNIEKIVTVEKPLEFNFSGNVKDGYYTDMEMLSSDIKTVSVSAPESVAETVTKGIVTVDLNGKHSHFSESCNIVLVNGENDAIPMENVTLLNNAVQVECKVYSKKIVGIDVKGIPENIEYEIVPSAIEIAGEEKTLDEIESVSASDFLLNSHKEGFKQKLQLDLPDDVILITDVTPQIVIKSLKEEADN